MVYGKRNLTLRVATEVFRTHSVLAVEVVRQRSVSAPKISDRL
jgi:hypothetical protein